MAQRHPGPVGLASFLEHSFNCSKTGQRIQFPDHLVDALLQTQFSLDSHSISRIISIVEKTHTLQLTLYEDSLRCLACVLLDSNILSGQEHGLRLLLHNPTDIEKASAATPLSTRQSQLIQRKLLAALCRVFLDGNQDLGLRRLAGELLLEILSKLQCAGEPDSEELDWLEIVSIFCHHGDVVLRFFAGAVLRSLHGLDVNTEALWALDNADYRPLFIESLQKYQDDWSRSFYFYAREVEHQNTQVSCYSLNYLKLDTVSYVDHFILATANSDGLTFIIPNSKPPRRPFQLVEIHFKSISQSGYCRTENERFELRLHLGGTGSIMKDGKQQKSPGSIVCLVSDGDLTGVWTKVQNTSNQTQGPIEMKRSGGRRSSSILIHLDTGDEVAEKSDQYFEDTSHMRESTDDGRPAILPSEIPHIETGSSVADDNRLAKQSSGITSFNKDRGNLQAISPDTKLPAPVQDDPDPLIVAVNSASFAGGTTDISRVRGIGSKASKMLLTGPEKTLEGTRTEETEKLSPGHTGLAPTAQKKKAPPPDTQESLLFPHPRRTKRKIYTKPSNASVDWDEDLRPSDDDEKAETERDFDFTSISSPFPSDSSALGRTVGTARKKRNSVPSRKGGKGTKQVKTSKAKCRKGKPKGSRLPLFPRGSNADNRQSAKSVHQDQKSQDESNGGVHGRFVKDDADYGEKTGEENLQYTPRSVLSTHESISPCNSTVPFLEGQFDSENITVFKSLGLLSGASVCSDKFRGASAIWSAKEESNWGDSIHDYNLDGGYNPEIKSKSRVRRKQGRGNTLGKKLIAALLQASDPPDGTSFERDENNGRISPCNGKEMQRQMSLREDQDHIPQLTWHNTLEADAQLAGIASGDNSLETGPLKKVSGDNPSPKRGSGARDQENAPDDRNCEQETIRPISRKRAATYGQNKSQKKHRPDALEAQRSETRDGASSQGNSDIENASWVTIEDGASETQLANPDRVHSEETTAVDLSGTSTLDRYSVKKLPKAVVDANGSPRLRSARFFDWRMPVANIPGKWQDQSTLTEQMVLECSQPGAGDCDSDTTEYYPLDMPTFRDRVRLNFGEDLAGPKGETALSEPGSGTSLKDVEHGLSTARLQRASSVNTSFEEVAARSVSTPVSMSDTHALETESGPAPTSLGSIVRNPLQIESELTGLHSLEKEDITDTWQTSLQTIQSSTDIILLNTSQDIMRHIKREQEAINRVLELYVQGCHRVLDRLFKAQEERIAGYKQQMEAIQEHQAGLCRGLMQRLERKPCQQ